MKKQQPEHSHSNLFAQYCFKYRWFFAGLIFISGMAYAYWMTNYTVSIDEESAWYYGSSLISVINAFVIDGKFAHPLLGFLTQTTMPVPFYNIAISVLFLCAFCVIMGYLYYVQGENSKWKFLFVSSLFVTFPSHAYILAFSFMAPAIFLGYSLNLFAVILLNSWVYDHKFRAAPFAGAVVLCTLTIATYQSLAACFLMIACIYSLPHLNSDKIRFKEAISIAAKYIAALVCSCVCYFAANRIIQIFRPSRPYLDSYVGWGGKSLAEIAKIFFDFPLRVLDGGIVYGSMGLPVCLTLMIIVFAFRIIREKTLRMINLAALSLVPLTFLLVFVLGNSVQIRTMQTLPLLLMGAWCYILLSLPPLSFRVNAAIAFGCVYLITFQTVSVNRISYTAVHRYQQDVALAYRVIDRVESVTGNEVGKKPLVFIGSRGPKIDETTTISAETVSASFFGWDHALAQDRKMKLFRHLGYPYTVISKDNVVGIWPECQSMPIWPAEGSVKEFPNYIIVKLTDYLYSDTIIEVNSASKSLDEINISEHALSSVHSIEYEIFRCEIRGSGDSSQVMISGWIYDSMDNKPITRLSVGSGDSYYYSTSKLLMSGYGERLGDESLDYVGFEFAVSIKALPEGDLPLRFIGVAADGESEFCVDTGITVRKNPSENSIEIIR